MTQGRFISLEGGEGAGKSTQAHALAAALHARGVPVVVTREPGGSAGAEAIRTLLLTGEASRWSARSEALLFAAARADHVERTIAPALSAGSWVICDRFVDSTRAYQGAGPGIGDDAIMRLHAFGSQGLLPDRTFVLDAGEEGARRAAARDRGRPDRIGARDPAFHQAVATAFRTIAAQEPGRVRIIDARGKADEVTAALLAGIVDLL